MKLADLRQPPFSLGSDAIEWVRKTRAGLDLDAKLGQIMLPFCRDLSEGG